MWATVWMLQARNRASTEPIVLGGGTTVVGEVLAGHDTALVPTSMLTLTLQVHIDVGANTSTSMHPTSRFT